MPIWLISIVMFHSVMSSNIDVDCAPMTKVSGCYRIKENKIYIGKNFDEQRKTYTLFHESYHFLNHGGDINEQERLAHQFALWNLGYRVSKSDEQHFKTLIK